MCDLVNLVIFILSCYGGANGIVYSRLLQPFRNWIMYSNRNYDPTYGHLVSATLRKSRTFKFLGKLINCPMCIGFWLGIIYSLGIYSPTSNTMWYPWSFSLTALIFDGFLGSAAAWIIHLLLYSRMMGEDHTPQVKSKPCKSCSSDSKSTPVSTVSDGSESKL